MLLDLSARQQTFVPLPDLAVPYAAGICEHLQVEDRQSTSARSQFLDACRSHNRGELDAAQLAEVTIRLGFTNVIDAFHISRGGEPTQTRFFVDERAGRQGITLTDHLLDLANGQQAAVLPREVDARWNLVQMSWGLRLGTRLVSFEMAPDEDAVDLYAPARLRRGPITGVRDALSGYQDGRCAYCQSPFTDIGTSRVAVDHVLPFVLMSRMGRRRPPPGLESRPSLLRVRLGQTRPPTGRRLDAMAGTAWRVPHRLAPSPARDLDQPARLGPRLPASDACTTPHRGNRDDPALDTGLYLFRRINPKRVGVAHTDIPLSPIKYFRAADPQVAWSIHGTLSYLRWAVVTGYPQVHALQQAAPFAITENPRGRPHITQEAAAFAFSIPGRLHKGMRHPRPSVSAAGEY